MPVTKLGSCACGLTLVELLVTIAVLAILLSVSTPSFENFIQRSNRDAASSELFNALQFARAEAVRRGTNVSLRSRSNAASNEWGTAGWCIAEGAPADCNGTIIKTYTEVNSNVRTNALGNVQLITFTPNGSISAGLDTFNICQNAGDGQSITLLASGIARVADINNCP